MHIWAPRTTFEILWPFVDIILIVHAIGRRINQCTTGRNAIQKDHTIAITMRTLEEMPE